HAGRVRCSSLVRHQPLGLPAANAFTSFVVSGVPPYPQSPLLTSSITTRVACRKFSPSIDTIVSVSLRAISCFSLGVKTPSITLTFTSGMGVLLPECRVALVVSHAPQLTSACRRVAWRGVWWKNQQARHQVHKRTNGRSFKLELIITTVRAIVKT